MKNDRMFEEDVCKCEHPQFEENTIHEQRGGEIVEVSFGRYCVKCGGIEPSVALEEEKCS